jgi:hypothetical protein
MKILFTGIIIICLALLWAALHDIIKGEEDITAEIFAVVISFAGIILASSRLRKIHSSKA